MSANGNIFRVTGPMWGESTDRWSIPLTKVSNVEHWWFLSCAPEHTADQTADLLVIWDAMALLMTPLQWAGKLFVDLVKCCITVLYLRNAFLSTTWKIKKLYSCLFMTWYLPYQFRFATNTGLCQLGSVVSSYVIDILRWCHWICWNLNNIFWKTIPESVLYFNVMLRSLLVNSLRRSDAHMRQ